jgi:ADP-ribosylglycohydrolase
MSLQAHWIYDVKEIENRFGRVQGLADPPADSHHKNKKAGDFTHYGDQMLTLLESLSQSGGFDLQDFFRRWRLLFTDYDGYKDMATRTTLKNIENGAGPEDSGSKSHDLAGASRLAPLTAFYADNLEGLVAAARKQAKMTHNYSAVIDSAEFFARTAHGVMHGQTPEQALRAAADRSYMSLPAADWVESGIKFAGSETVSATRNFGQSCHVEGAFRSTVQVIARHSGEPATGIIETIMAGGDSAARGILAGLILGASAEADALPDEWFSGLNTGGRIERMLSSD